MRTLTSATGCGRLGDLADRDSPAAARLLKGRESGPLFLTDRKARVEATEGKQGGPWTLHQLRHSALTHDAENGASTPMLMAKSGHASVASLARYAKPSAEALQRWQERNDPARRN